MNQHTDSLLLAKQVYEKPFKARKPSVSVQSSAPEQLQQSSARPSTYFQTSNSSGLSIPLTYSSKTLIGNWQENQSYEQLPRHKQLVNGNDYFENRVTAGGYSSSLKAFNQSSSLQYFHE